tara:strand:+ start:3130 stop:3591 length:462 start_codon:yes stop_codon:yes gene_type:complete
MTIEKIAEQQYGLCIEDCDYLEDKAIWVASLSNGLLVHQDDYRSGKEPIAWKRLGRYCKLESIDISGMYLKFRSHIIPSPDEADGYYFAYGAHKEFDENHTRQHYVFGYAVDKNVHYGWYANPELILTKERTRKINKDDVNDQRLILRQNIHA